MRKSVLVTGGSGFIGSSFINLLIEKGLAQKVVCVDLLTPLSNPNTLKNLFSNPAFSFYKEDIANQDAIDRIFDKEHPDVVVNFAAESHVDRSIVDPSPFLKTNILGTHVLLQASRKYGIQRFHQVSTDEVYGELPLDRPDLLFREDSLICPSNPYSASKASADMLALAFGRTYGLPITISRSSNNYGPYQFPDKLIPLTINNALHNKAIPVYGNGLNVRDWLYVKDHCYGILAILEKGKVGEVYNLGGRNERNNLNIVKTILKELGKPESLITFVSDRKGHDQRYAIDPTKTMKELGWTPTIAFEQGITMTIQWYKDNMGWVDECTGGAFGLLREDV